jgi:CHAT domain-containing protein
MVSSYTPTLTALHRLLQGQNADFNDPGSGIPRVLLLAQPRLEGNLSLPNAQAELDVVRTLIPAQCMTNSRDQTELSIEEALQGAMAAHIFHLACHGHQDQEHPLKSGFDVRDGRLTIAQLMKISTPYAQLAYLSACESARVDTSRPDQILHLAATMIFIGFKSVIGTMWYGATIL